MTEAAGFFPVATSMVSRTPFVELLATRHPSLVFWPNGRLRPERFYDCFVSLDVRSADEVDAVRHRGEDAVDDGLAVFVFNAFERFLDRLRLPGKVENQRFSADHADLPRENRGRHEFKADLPHLLAETRHDLV